MKFWKTLDAEIMVIIYLLWPTPPKWPIGTSKHALNLKKNDEYS